MTDVEPFLIVFFRWLHIATACIAVGGVFFIRIVLPIAIKTLDADASRMMMQRTLRVFKMVVHSCILLLLVSGTFNAWINWPKYTALGPAVGHSLFGTHLLLGLIIFAIALWLLVGKEPRRDVLKWMAVLLGLMFLTIATASVLKYARDTHAAQTLIIQR